MFESVFHLVIGRSSGVLERSIGEVCFSSGFFSLDVVLSFLVKLDLISPAHSTKAVPTTIAFLPIMNATGVVELL